MESERKRSLLKSVVQRFRVRTWAGEHVHDPVFWTDVIQLAKTVVAAVVAWVLAAEVFGLPQPFLAPWAALLVVHATIYRTFSQGAKQVSATVAGVVFAWGTGNLLGLDWVALTVMLLAAMAFAQFSYFREESTTVAATALVVLTTGYSDQDAVLIMRLVDTAIGVGVGLLVNLVVWPPLRDRTAARAIDAIDDRAGELLCDMASALRDDPGDEEVHSWVERTEEIDDEIDSAWALVRQARESARLNPRRSAGDVRHERQFDEVLRRLEQSVAEIRSMARTLEHSVTNVLEWEPGFRETWIDILDETGLAITAADSDRLRAARNRLRRLAEDLSTDDLPGQHWPEYGALIANLRNIITSMDVVADDNPITPSRVHRRLASKG